MLISRLKGPGRRGGLHRRSGFHMDRPLRPGACNLIWNRRDFSKPDSSAPPGNSRVSRGQGAAQRHFETMGYESGDHLRSYPGRKPQDLLAHLDWVRELAKRLTHDENVADDLSQDALLLALDRAPREPGSLRSWLRTALEQLGHTRRRSEARRADRETESVERACTEPVAPSTADLVERAGTHRRIVDELLALKEPYRTTLLLRFFEGLSQREIAERMAVPTSTAGSRIAEGLSRLRRRLGGPASKRSWLPALLPILQRSEGSASAPLSSLSSAALLMTTTTKLLLTALLAGGAFLAYRATYPRPDLTPLARTMTPTEEEVLATGPEPLAQRRTSLKATPEAVEEKVVTLRPEHLPIGLRGEPVAIRGRVIDMEGHGVAGVKIERSIPGWEGPSPSGYFAPEPIRSTQDGRFEMTEKLPLRLQVVDDMYAAICEARMFHNRDGSYATLLVARSIPMAGHVIDEGGRAVAGAEVVYLIEESRLNQPGREFDNSVFVRPRTKTDGEGAFELGSVPEVDSSQLRVSAPGFQIARVLAPRDGDRSLRVVLRQSMDGPLNLTGTVVFSNGEPAPGALVTGGNIAVSADADGAFLLEPYHLGRTLGPEDTLTLNAGLAGFLPATKTLPPRSTLAGGHWGPIVLELGAPPLTMSGRVIDENGKPVRGAMVDALDTTPFGFVEIEGARGYARRSLEQIAGGGEVRTDFRGRFELRGLEERTYRIAVMLRPSLLYLESEAFPAGAKDVVLTIDRSALGELAGRVVDHSGRAIEGVRVAVTRKRPNELAIGQADTTDPNGSFVLEGVPRDPEYLRLEGNAIVPNLFYELDPQVDRESLEIIASRRCQLQIDWGDWESRADKLHLIDANGDRVELMDLKGAGLSPRSSLTVTTGLSLVLAMPTTATYAVLSQDGVEVTRVPVNPIPGELELLRL